MFNRNLLGLITITTTIALFSGMLSLNVFADTYLGSGKWPLSTQNYKTDSSCSSRHRTAIDTAAAMWRDQTDFNLYGSTTNYKIKIVAYDYGDANWDGYTFITPSNFNSTYTYATIHLNKYFIDGLRPAPDNVPYGTARLNAVVTHEFGHSISLGHVGSLASIMYGISDVYHAVLKTPSLKTTLGTLEVDAVNSRY